MIEKPDWAFGPDAMPSITEPRAELRQSAASMFEVYTAYVAAGFTAEQAMMLLLQLMVIQGK